MKYNFITTLLVSMSVSIFSQAKVKDFNDIINEDIKAQKELHQQLENKVYSDNELKEKSLEVTEKTPKQVIVIENSQSNYIAPSKANFLKFRKETKQKLPSERKNQHRVAKEIKELGL